MAMATDDKPCVEERYQTASNTSDLTAKGGDADKGGAVDILIAAGWGSTRIGMALLRLHSEFDSSVKPTKPTPDFIRGLVGTYQQGEPQRLTPANATQYAGAWYIAEMGRLLSRLQALPDAREQLAIRALQWGMGRSDDPRTRSNIKQDREYDAALLERLRADVEAAGEDVELLEYVKKTLELAQAGVAKRRQAERRAEMVRATEKAAGVIRYWLDQTCHSCHGLRWQVAPGAPVLSNRMCRMCAGSGVAQIPYGQDGRRLANWMDSCIESARTMIGRNMSRRRQARDPELRKLLQVRE